MYKMKVWIWTMGMLAVLAFVHIALWEFFGSRHITVERALHIVLPGYQPASLGGSLSSWDVSIRQVICKLIACLYCHRL